MTMINPHGRLERIDRMAVLADVVGSDMRRRFAERIDIVVALRAVPGDGSMIEARGLPRQRRMAGVAFQRRLHMPLGFTGRPSTVMATAATAEHVQVVHDHHRLESND